jgi:RecJ-like exonuclease
MIERIKGFSKILLEKTEKRNILLISHFDTDGITSAAIIAKSLKKLNRNFSIKIIKSFDKGILENIPKSKVLIFLDLASSALKELSEIENQVLIIDHHEINKETIINSNIEIINPHLWENKEEMSSSCLSYLISKEISGKDSESANLAIIGMVGDLMEKKVGFLVNSLIEDAEVTIKKGLLLYPSTRPINKTLEYSSNPYIPGITGNYQATIDLLREAGISFTSNGYKSLSELDEDEMRKLVTAIALKIPNPDKMSEFIGNLYLLKFFGRVEDAREMSALINACSRMGESNTALLLCMGNNEAKKQAEKIYIRYKQALLEGLDYANKNSKIESEKYIILNAKDKIQDTIIGTIASILSMSALYKEGTIIIAMAYNNDKIKVSSRICGKERIESRNTNLRDIMTGVTELIGGDAGGHKFAAGCVINKEKEEAFIDLIKKKLEVEIVKI